MIWFIAPLGLALFISICLYTAIITKLAIVARKTKAVRSNHNEKLMIAVKLLLVLGFNWLFAVIAAIKRDHVTVFIFIVTCASQGFFGFIVFVCNKRTLQDLRRCYGERKSEQVELTPTSDPVRTYQKGRKESEACKKLLKTETTSCIN